MMMDKILFTVYIFYACLFTLFQDKIKNPKLRFILKIVLVVVSVLYTIYFYLITN